MEEDRVLTVTVKDWRRKADEDLRVMFNAMRQAAEITANVKVAGGTAEQRSRYTKLIHKIIETVNEMEAIANAAAFRVADS